MALLTRIMCLNVLDGLELQRDDEVKARHRLPYRRHNWAARSDNIIGGKFLSFINNKDAILSNGVKGTGRFRYLRTPSAPTEATSRWD